MWINEWKTLGQKPIRPFQISDHSKINKATRPDTFKRKSEILSYSRSNCLPVPAPVSFKHWEPPAMPIPMASGIWNESWNPTPKAHVNPIWGKLVQLPLFPFPSMLPQHSRLDFYSALWESLTGITALNHSLLSWKLDIPPWPSLKAKLLPLKTPATHKP